MQGEVVCMCTGHPLTLCHRPPARRSMVWGALSKDPRPKALSACKRLLTLNIKWTSYEMASGSGVQTNSY